MKDFRQMVDTYVLDHEKHKKYLAFVLALSMMVTFAVPLSLMQPAESMTANREFLATELANATGEVVTVTDEQKKVDLLVGSGSPLAASTVQGTIANADAAYAIGLASQFSVFLLGDFNDSSCDSEGRTAVGGAINTSTAYDTKGDFDVGSGDFASKTSLESLLGLTGYADVIAGVEIKNLSVCSNDKYKDFEGGAEYYNPKTFAINPTGTINMESLKCAEGAKSDVNQLDVQYYKTDTNLIDFAAEFNKLTLRSQKLFERETEETQILYTNTKEIIYENGNWVKSYDQATTTPNSSDRWATTVHFVYTGEETEVVVFNLTQAEWDTMVEKAAHQSFEGIPEGAYIIINVDGGIINIGGDYRFYYLNGEQISSGTGNTFNGITATHGTGDHAVGNTAGNNDYRCSYFLYNFPNATELKIYNNFSGTILAPNAAVKGENKGHLSGALVAKSFEGNFEFGYKPYTGPYSLLGSTSGYTIPVDKFKSDGETPLPGAAFKLTITDQNGDVVTSWTSGDSTEYVTIPTMIDFTGGVTYTDDPDDIPENNLEQTRSYTVKEESSPEGYIRTEKTYTLTVKETITKETLLPVEGGGTIPRDVAVEITITSDTGENLSLPTFTITDEYSEDAQTMRKIKIGDTIYFLNMQDGKVKEVNKSVGESSVATTDIAHVYTTSIGGDALHKYTIPIEVETGTTIVTDVEVPAASTEASTVEPDESDANESGTDTAETTSTETTTATSATTSILTDIMTTISTSVEESTEGTTYTEIETSTTAKSSYTTYTTVTVLNSEEVKTEGTVTETNGSETKTYYFAPNSLMFMPMPANNLEFINEYGFVFKKVDENGNPVADATVILEKKDGEAYAEAMQITASSLTIDPKTLDVNTLYRFREAVVPDGYEQADPVYLVKLSDGRIFYRASASEPAMPTAESHEGWTVFTINAADDDRVIPMTDQKIHGYKLVLNKADAGTKNLLNGAYFKLYAANNDLVYPKENLYQNDPDTEADESQQAGFRIDGTLDLFEELKNAAENTYDSNYVDDGYLKKGTYYLEEVTAPGGYEKPSTPFRFKINYENGEYSLEILSSGDAAGDYVTAFEGSLTGPGGQHNESNSYADVTAIEAIFRLDGTDTSKILENNALNIQGGDGWLSGISAWNNLFKNTTLGSYELTELGGGDYSMKYNFNSPVSLDGTKNIQYQSNASHITLKEVRIYGSGGGSSNDSSGSGSTTTYTYGQTAWNDNNADTIQIDTFTVYYTDGTQQVVTSPTHGSQGNYWMPINISLNKTDGIAAIQIVTKGSGTRKLMIQASDNKTAIFEQDVTAGQTYTFGTIPTTPDPTEPAEPTEPVETDNVAAPPLETNTDGELIIPNSQLGANIGLTVQKDWLKDEGYEFARTSEIKVELYRTDALEKVAAKQGELYKEITLNAANSWTFNETVPRLIHPGTADTSIYYYYVKEIDPPAGYTVSYENNDGESVKDGGIIHVKNELQTISLNVKKAWDAKGASTPSSVQVKLQYSADGQTWTDVPNSTQTLTGSGWTHSYTGLPSNFQYRAVEVKVPTGWIASDNGQSNESSTDGDTLTITNTLKTGKLNLMKKWANGAPSSGSVKVRLYRATVRPGTGGSGGSSGGGSAEGDTTGGNTEVADDAVVARFLYQKGNGDTDHSTYWGPPENQPSRANQLYWTTNSASDIAANYAATLAQFAVNFPDDDKSENYLNAAKALYDFSTKYNSCATENCSGFYPAKSCTDEQAWAAAWLYLATNDTSYKTACESKLSQCGNPEQRGYFWDDVMLGAEAVYAAHIDDTPSWTKVTNYLNTYCTGDSFRVLDQWGSARHNALLQTLALVTDKNMNTTNYQAWCKNQMAFILGNNNYNRNFVVGFADNSMKNPHHKAATGKIIVDTVNGISWDAYWNSWNGVFGEESHVLVGALASGPRNNRVNDSCRDPEGNEVALDYNAGLVGAAAGLYSVYGTGTLVNNGADIDSEVESKYDGFAVTRQPIYTSNITEDYSRLLQYSLYFYDANMCGDFTEENSAFSWRSACHTDDEVDGGFHDAGDHVMFGLPQGFSASTLGWVYYEFRDSFDSLGQTAHYKTIMEEFCDFFVDSIEFAETTQQTLTLRNTTSQQQSQKATSIKGISMVGSDVKAKATVEYTIDSSNNAELFAAITSNGGNLPSELQGAEISKIVFSLTGSSAEIKLNEVNVFNGGDTIPSSGATFVDNIYTINSQNGFFVGNWGNSVASNGITSIKFSKWGNDLNYIKIYYEPTTPPTPQFTISADKSTALLTDTVTLTPTNNAGNVTYTVKYADNSTETLTGNSFIPKKSGTVTITGNDGAANAETAIIVSPMTIGSISNNPINIGETTTITLDNPGFGTITWKVTDANGNELNGIATVTSFDNNSATITANKGGDFYVTVTDANGNSVRTSNSIHVNGPSITAPDPITEGQDGTITIGGLTGSYTVKLGDTVLTGSNNTYSFTAPDVNAATQYTISVVMNNETVVTKQITVNPFAITQDSVSVTEYGGTATLTANAPAKWTVQDVYNDNITLEIIDGGKSCIVRGGAYTGDTITVTATDDKNNSDTAAITMQMSSSLNISIKEGKTAIRIGDTVTLDAVPNNNVTYYFEPADRVQFDAATNKITALTEGQVTINAKRGENTWAQQTIPLTIHPALTLTGDDTMNAGETQTLQVAGNIGNLTWTSDNEAAVTVDQNGNVTAVANGAAVITVKDAADEKSVTFMITVKQSAVNANVPAGAQHIADVEITGSGDQWTTNRVVATYNGVTSLDLGNLPLTDGNGNTYYYYIEEVIDGNETLVTDNAVYVPSNYENNGAVPSEGGNTISVENTKISDAETTGQMPSAGGEGTDWYYMAGAAMILAGIAGYFVLKRRQSSRADA